MSSTTTVFVSGANGFIAQHIVKHLIAKGYNVVGSVRSPAKGESLKKNVGDKFSYEIVEDLTKEGCFDEALKNHPEVTVFLHTASPFTLAIEDPEKDLILPAIKGTLNALKGIKALAPQITRVVITSSCASVVDMAGNAPPFQQYTEENWNPVTYEKAKSNVFDGYCGSKTFAERAAWDFVENENPHFSLSVINPSYVFGPQAFDEDAKKSSLNTSSEIIGSLLKTKPSDKVSPSYGGFVDVRNVADAHILAFEKDEAKGKRFILNDVNFTSQSVLNIIRKQFPQLQSKITEGGDETIDADAVWGTAKNDRAKEILKIDFISLEKSVVDSVAQLLKYHTI
ncbi:hypothetical protein CANARDRAFT_8789 [[Candida] arabinofermentans NRRL YB-2248]|uniref:NAD-dependent epimerase/dehydratase domain-containing protein n=1 Tax=[Candida] arabinofermentans NRRL YB-2248 TaxID=983967 RepID=A0A1E4SX75_9ASCO|nr:hypothetical protein CANARDRAFT_8789 [[Candida] arabinofermentans NRRL YB-2248]